jgi:hypothetical protein
VVCCVEGNKEIQYININTTGWTRSKLDLRCTKRKGGRNKETAKSDENSEIRKREMVRRKKCRCADREGRKEESVD